MKIRKLDATEVEFTIEIEPEDTPVRGNALASGDDEADRSCEDEIIARLDDGDLWAWCHVIVRARWHGFEGSDALGCCSYADEADFKTTGGYYESMRDQALDDLQQRIEATGRELADLIEDDNYVEPSRAAVMATVREMARVEREGMDPEEK